MHTISREQARLLELHSQYLLPATGKKGHSTLEIIEHLGYVQIDTLAVIARAHNHTLWSRLPDYNEQNLQRLLENDKTIFEYWSHAASYLPMCDFRFSLLRKKDYALGKSHWFAQDKKIKKYVLDRIKAEGALQSKDFEHKRVGPGNWYEWKPAKRALEQLFMEGKLMVAKRQGFQKVYDLTERVLPENVDVSVPAEKEIAEHLIKKSVQAHGIVEANEITYLRSGLKEPVNKALGHLLKEGELVEAQIDGFGKTTFFTSEHHLNAIQKIKITDAVHFLSPFDNAIIQRKRLLKLFDFDYMMECYVPEQKRKYGYFTLPVLHGDKFVARFDPKADRATKTFHIKSIHFEKGFKPDPTFNELFVAKLKNFARFNACDKIVIANADTKWKKQIIPLMQNEH